MHKRKPRVLGTVIAALAVLITAAGSSATAPLTVVSRPSPFASCTIGGPDPNFANDTNFVNGEVEPEVDVNPRDRSNIVGVFQQDHWSTGGAHGLVAAVTHDGGLTWTESFAHFSSCSGGTAG